MKKNVKILGAAAAALLAVAPVVASATTANADFTINPGITNNQPSSTPLNINISLNATAGVTTGTDAANSVKASSSIGTLNRLTGSTVKIIDPKNNDKEVTADKLVAGHYYKVQITNVQVAGLTNSMTYNLGQAKFGNSSNPTGSGLMTHNTLTSAPFSLTDANDPTQPFFYNKDDNTNQLADGATAYVNKGAGVTLHSDPTAEEILAAAQNAVHTSTAPTANGPVVWTTEDVAKQLKDQGIKEKAGQKYDIPTTGFHITLSMKNLSSGKSVSVVVPFAGSKADVSDFPYVAFDNSSATSDGYNDNFKDLTAQGKQNKASDQLVRNVELGSRFNSGDAVTGFNAWVKAPANGTNTSPRIDMAVLSNPVNTQVPGQYTVTLQATNWANGKTTVLSYIVQVGQSDATYQTVNYPAAYGVNVWNIAGNTASFTGRRVQGGSRVATFGTKTVNGVSYTEINKKGSNEWIQTQYLGNHSNENKPSNNGETKLNGVGRVSYNGKGAVRLLNGEGHYVDQYVKKGASFKVWAEKTVNGQHLYRIGSQSQWIPAKYFSLN